MATHLLLLLVFSLALSDCFAINASRHRQQQQSLLAFKSSLTFDPNHSLSNWTVDIPFCNWAGVICDIQQDRVLSLNLSTMGLQGSISSHLANMPFLETLDLSANALNGSIPPQLGSFSQLKYLSLRRNKVGGAIPSSLGSLSGLIHLDLGHNVISGQIPNQIGNLTNLAILDFRVNHLSGTIPSLRRLENLERLFLQKNQFVGTIPDEFGQLKNLRLLKISHNRLSGRIAQSIGNLQRLKMLFLHHNHLSDMIPASLGYCKNLQLLDLSHNSLIGSIPQEVADLSHIRFYLNLSFNYLEGSIPQEVGKLMRATAVDISHNRLNGVIPETLGNCTALQYLYLARNALEGSLPNSLGNLQNLRYLDLSSNSLSGTIPLSFKMLKSLHSLNLSFNCLAVHEDEGRSFANGTGVISLVGNVGLFGSNVSSLSACGSRNSHMVTPPLRITKVRGAVAAGAFGVTAFIFLLGILWIRRLEMRILYENSYHLGLSVFKFRRISYEDIVRATDTFSDANLLGEGNSGAVYRGILWDGRTVAVKVFNFDADKKFEAEWRALRRIRHRNVAKVIDTCSTDDFKALIFEFMCNGSLEKHLYPYDESCELGLKELLNIAIDLAHAIEYLHHDCDHDVQIVHCDIKPSNVLLDEDMVAYLTDFGIATLKRRTKRRTFEPVDFEVLKGTVGYIAPECGLTRRISTGRDVYSYGILLLEMLTGERPTSGIFDGNVTLHDVLGLVDQRLFTNTGDNEFRTVVLLLYLGLWCSKDSLNARPNMKQVLVQLEIIKKKWVRATSYSSTVDMMQQVSEESVTSSSLNSHISYHDILKATDKFSEANLLGKDNSGAVYKGIMRDGRGVVVKVFNFDAYQKFTAELTVLRWIQHQNVAEIMATCSTHNFKALIFGFMCNESLEKHLYPDYLPSCEPRLKERLNIAIDLAHAIKYLHYDCDVQIVHGDINPRNVLLDQDMTAYLIGFGIARIIERTPRIKDSVGYFAPECGFGRSISTQGDVCSFGILLLEILTGKSPTNEMFKGGHLTLHKWVKSAFSFRVSDVVNQWLITSNDEIRFVISLLRIGLWCSKKSPEARPNIKQVADRLDIIKHELVTGGRDFEIHPTLDLSQEQVRGGVEFFG